MIDLHPANTEVRDRYRAGAMSNPAVGAAGGDVEEATCLHALELISASAVSMTVKAAIELGLIDALSMAAGRAMTADELSAQLPAADKAEAAASVDRLLRFLACYNVVKCSTETSPSGEPLRQYTAAPVCRWLTSNSSEGSLAPLAKFAVDKDYLPSWNHLGAAVAGGGPAAFERAYGVPMFQYMGTNTRLNRLFNKAMAQQTMMVISKLLERFKGFDGISVLVDVGGGTGATLEMITSRYKHIRGINFDLPHALSEAPAIPGHGKAPLEVIVCPSMLLKTLAGCHPGELHLALPANIHHIYHCGVGRGFAALHLKRGK